MIQAIKDCNVLKLNSFLTCRGSYSKKELNFCFFTTAQSGNVECMKCLLDNCTDLDVNVTNSSGKTALMLSAENGHCEMLSLLLADVRCKIDARNENSDQTALHFAVKSNSVECVKKLLDAGAKTSVTDSEGNTPLILSSTLRMPNLALIKLLTTDNKDINLQNKHGQTALHCTSCQAIGTEMLLALGANPNLQDLTGNTPLHIASIEGLDSIITCLVTHNCNVNICNNYGRLALHYLSMKGHELCVEMIAKVGGELNSLDRDNKSPLIYTIENKRFKAFVSLLSNNCCPNVCNSIVSYTPLEVAFKLKLYVEVMMLLLVGCDVKSFWQIISASDDLNERLMSASLEDYDEDDNLINTVTNGNNDNENIENESNTCYIDWSLRYISHTPTLKHLCRLSIRKLVRADVSYKKLLSSLLPPLLQDYVLFKGCYSLYNYIKKEHLKARI